MRSYMPPLDNAQMLHANQDKVQAKLPVQDVVIVPTPAAETKSRRDVTNDVNLDSGGKKQKTSLN